MRPQLSLLTEPKTVHWLGWLTLVVIGGSAFGAIRLAVATAEPGIVGAGRLWVAAILMTAYAVGTGRSLPPLFEKTDKGTMIDHRWRFMLACGFIGYTIPFWLFPFAQQTVSSLLAGIYMAFMPLITLFMAAIFASEKLTKLKIVGFALGTAGVICLMGPAAFSGTGGIAALIAQGALLLANLCYAIYAVLTRRAPEMQARSFAAGMLLCAAITSTPMLIFSGQDWSALTLKSILAIVYLGVLPSGIASILIFWLIRNVGAGFMATCNYVTPIVAILIGTIFFHETLSTNFIFGLVLILFGLAVSRYQRSTHHAAQIDVTTSPRK